MTNYGTFLNQLKPWIMEANEYIEKALAGLKDFQLETVNYTIKQFFENNKTKMLIADEVGLGKTIVSR